MNEHYRGDVLLYFAFLAGQILFVLKRVAMAIRSKSNLLVTRRDYLKHNWDVLLIRAGLELPLFYLWRHYSLASLLTLVGVAWQAPFQVPVTGVTALMLGFLADSVLDWLSQWEKLPARIREQIPPLNNAGST